ncbi:MAG: hypothetical protein Q8K32_09255 [Archangium sp.]|nr:hypothetical protein [Archangium sp.]
MTEAIETTLAARELAEQVAAAREEVRAAIIRHLQDCASKPKRPEDRSRMAWAAYAVSEVPLTFTPLADRIQSLEADALELSREDERGHRLIDAAHREAIGTSSADTLATRVERLLAKLAAEGDLIVALQQELNDARAALADSDRQLTGANVEASLLRSQLASARVGHDQVVLLKADYERLIASLPVRPRLSVVEKPALELIACGAEIINRSTGKKSFCSLAPDHEGLHEGPRSHDS